MTPTITQHDPTTMTVDAADTTEPIIRMTRMFDAPRALVWRVFTDPKHVARWYGGHGIENPVCEMDVRAGGLWRHVMRFPDGTEFPLELVFVEVTPPSRLVWKNADFETRTSGPPPCVNSVSLLEEGRRTRLVLVSRFRTFADREAAAKSQFAQMVSQGSEKLARILERLEREGADA